MNAFSKMCAVLILCVFCSLPVIAQTGADQADARTAEVERLFEAANKLMEQSKFDAALAKYQQILAIEPDAPGPLYNGGLAAFIGKNYEEALRFWKRLKEIDPADWQLRTKLIQTYQALGLTEKRDAERGELFKLRAEGNIGELRDAEYYVREQAEFSGRRVMVFEHFELKGDRALRYVFYILGDDGKPEFRISLGSYETTNRIWKELEKRGANERLFHLDGYFPNGHATYGMFTREPTYEETRQMVLKILAGEKNPISSSTVRTKPAEEKEKP